MLQQYTIIIPIFVATVRGWPFFSCLFQHDNSAHIKKQKVPEVMFGMEQLDWPALSPDLNLR